MFKILPTFLSYLLTYLFCHQSIYWSVFIYFTMLPSSFRQSCCFKKGKGQNILGYILYFLLWCENLYCTQRSSLQRCWKNFWIWGKGMLLRRVQSNAKNHSRSPRDFPWRSPRDFSWRSPREISRAGGLDFLIPPEFWWRTGILSSSIFLQWVLKSILPCWWWKNGKSFPHGRNLEGEDFPRPSRFPNTSLALFEHGYNTSLVLVDYRNIITLR